MQERVRRRVTARGRVQGVFFRDTVRREAERAGVAGWASNEPDGSVEVVLEGDQETVERLVALCRSGPGRAEVEEVSVREEEPEDLGDFEVR